MTLYDPDRPTIADLFCGAGGASMGYWWAGFQPFGVDIVAQKHYPFPFVQGDALAPPFDLSRFDAIHASPPCQGYSRLRHLPWLSHKVYPLLIQPTREMLAALAPRVPYIMENVEDAPLARQATLDGLHGLTLCGQMFDLPGQFRHRRFESTLSLRPLQHRRHGFVMAPGSKSLAKRYPGRFAGISGWQNAGGVGGHFGNKARAEASMGIDWMTTDELREAIPPAMTAYLGAQLLEHVMASRIGEAK